MEPPEADGPDQSRPEPWSARLLDAIEQGRLGLALLDTAARLLHVNRAACELIGRTESELIGRGLTELVHEDDAGWLGAELDLVLAGSVERLRREVRLVGDDRDTLSELSIRSVVDDPVRAIVVLEHAGDRQLRERELRRLADTDPLTNLLNRRRFTSDLERHLASAARYGSQGALLMLDVDGLKRINDMHGHLAGDQALIATANQLASHTRASDIVGRLGGDEFAILLPAASAEQAISAAAALREAIRSGRARSRPGPPTLSIGIAVIRDDSTTTSLMEDADNALYEVKRAGGDGYALARPLHASEVGPAPPQTGRPGRPGGDNRRRTAATVPVRAVLQSIAELGTASLELVAWELFADVQAIEPAWSIALRQGLIERAHVDAFDEEWQYQLTQTGHDRLRDLEHRARATGQSGWPSGRDG